MVRLVGVAVWVRTGRGWLVGLALGLLVTAGTASSRVLGLSGSRGLGVVAPGFVSSLQSVSCVSVADCWAVGWFASRHSGALSEALRWDGSTWSLAATPNPVGTSTMDYNELSGIACVSASNCWAVGYAQSAPGPALNLVLRWNGHSWSRVSVPQPDGTSSAYPDSTNHLNGVACVSASDCWAVGDYHPWPRNQALHWNGRRWSAVAMPQPAGTGTDHTNHLAAVTCSSASECWAVGYLQSRQVTGNQILRWDGASWKRAPTPGPGSGTGFPSYQLYGVTCASGPSCWAVGEITNHAGVHLDEALRWHAGKWSQTSVPQPAGSHPNALLGVACASRTNCWAIGDLGEHSAQRNQAQHWNGRRWSIAKTPDPAGTTSGAVNVLSGISCATTSSCWTIGYAQPSGKTSLNEALRWNGTGWSTR